jgi:hypothetical protein
MERTVSTIIPSIAPETSDVSLDRLLLPARFISHPDDVVEDETLGIQEKRAILASWVSDACAVESMPALRKPPGAAAPVSVDSVMDALRRLDEVCTNITGEFEPRQSPKRQPRLDF